MKQIIEIEVPEGKKAIWKDGKVVFEDSAPKLPETWEDFCELYSIKGWEHFIDSDSLILGAEKGKRLYKCDRNVLPSAEAAKAHLALMQLHQLRDCYRQGWTPDWKDLKFKYCIYCVENDYKICQSMNNNHFLSFQSMEIAKKFLKNFKDLIKQVGDLI